MLKNYFKTALRSLWRHRSYALINILGLAIGITGSMLLLTYVQDEYAFEKHHEHAERIVRPIMKQVNLEVPRHFAGNPLILATTLVEELPEVEAQTYLINFYGGQFNLEIDEQRFTERYYAMTDNDHFDVFSYDFIYGDPALALTNPFEMVLTESKAQALFGRTDVINQVVSAPNIGDFKIVGVVKDQPQNTHLQLQILLSRSVSGERWENVKNSWSSFGGASYLLIKEGTDFDLFKEKAAQLVAERLPDPLANMLEFDYQQLLDVHFNSAHIERDFAENKGDESYSIIFIIISSFLLIIASVNYMNLATSKAVFRAKEIGVRKVVGAGKRQLVFQFLIESLLITMMASLISIGLLDLVMPAFNSLVGKSFDFNWANLMEYLPALLGLTLMVALLSGLYPAFFMTKIPTTRVLKGEQVNGGSFHVRKALVVFQFVLGIFMLISMLVINDQMDFIKDKSLGFDESNLLTIDINNGAVRPVFKTMRNELSQITGVEAVSVTSRVPGEWKNIHEVEVQWTREEQLDSASFYLMNFDEYGQEVFNFDIVQGRYFSGNDQSDSTKILINQAAAKYLGLDEPVGQTIDLMSRTYGAYEIIGVVKDFHFQSLHNQIEPMIIGAWNNPASFIDYFTLRYAGDPSVIIEQANAIHEKFDSRTVMEYHFLDQQLDLFYENEAQANVIFQVGAGLSIFIACLGLLGLVSFTVQKRVKELGVRKVLGASHWNIFYMLSESFVKQVLLAFLLASPLAFIMMSNWLNNFQYKVSIGFGVFITAILTTITITLITISYRSYRAANTNPVRSLRSE